MFAAIHLNLTRDDIHQRGFSRTVSPNEGYALSIFDVKSHLLKNGFPVKGDGGILN
jgi:hypothetical protein